MRSPLHSEAEALDFLLLVIVVLLAIALAVSIGPTWLTLVVVAVVVTGLAARRARDARGQTEHAQGGAEECSRPRRAGRRASHPARRERHAE